MAKRVSASSLNRLFMQVGGEEAITCAQFVSQNVNHKNYKIMPHSNVEYELNVIYRP